IFRFAKSGNDWTSNDLLAYNISVRRQSSQDFFGLEPNSSLDNLDQQLLSATLDFDCDQLSDHSYRLLQYLYLAGTANANQESAVNDLGKEILRLMGYEERGTLLRSQYAIPFAICGDTTRTAQADVCLMHGTSAILLVFQGDKTEISSRDPEAQVIAKAIATFQYNNRARSRAGLDELDTMTIPCITMLGTCPVFYKVPVTKDLSNAIIMAQYPSEPTLVTKCIVAAALGTSRRLSEGMENPQFRKIALQHYEAFRELAGDLWDRFL
ncbi:hypothetical protein K435DRAFT_583757, partial [Dendrothele bispora CBS 962.96]